MTGGSADSPVFMYFDNLWAGAFLNFYLVEFILFLKYEEFLIDFNKNISYNEHMFEKDFVKKNITWITVGIILLLALVICILSYFLSDNTDQIIVLLDGQEYATYSLHDTQEIRIETNDGYNLLVIKDGQAYVAEADCDNQVCVHTAPINGRGGQIICLPHRIVIRLNSAKESEIDAVTN